MKAFVHREAKTVGEASAILREYGNKAAVIAGGTDILGLTKADAFPDYPAALVNIKNIPGLGAIKEEGGVLKIGALAKLADIADNATVKSSWSSLASAADQVSSQILREMGTLGGNLCQKVRCWYYRYPQIQGGRFLCFRKGGTICYATSGRNRIHAIVGGEVCFASFPSDMAIALSALNATIVTNKRSIPIDNFYIVLGNVLANDEIVTGVEVPKPAAGTKLTFTKNRVRECLDWALVSVASAITVEGGSVASARITLGGVAPVPWRATGSEDAIKGKAISETLARTAGRAAVADAVPLTENAYKIPIAETLVRRAIMA